MPHAVASPMTTEQLKQLALDIIEDRVFGSWNLPPPTSDDDVGALAMTFLPLALGAAAPEGTVHVYEYLSEAGPRVINGLPCFFSYAPISREDWAKLIQLILAEQNYRKGSPLANSPS